MELADKSLEFVTVEGLLNYGEVLARCARVEGAETPPIPNRSMDRVRLTRAAMEQVREFVRRSEAGFPDAETYRAARRELLDKACEGDDLILYAAWNKLLAQGELSPLLRAPIDRVQKPMQRRPVAIVPRASLTSQLVEGQIVLDLGEDRYWLLPRDLTGRTLLFTLRHGVSRVESGAYRVGRRLANSLDRDHGIPKADTVGTELTRMLGLVERQLDFLKIPNYLDPRRFAHRISRSPNTRELFERVVAALCPDASSSAQAAIDPALESQDYGWATGVEKSTEADEAARAFGGEPGAAVRVFGRPL
jgi:6-phosphofructokinase 1